MNIHDLLSHSIAQVALMPNDRIYNSTGNPNHIWTALVAGAIELGLEHDHVIHCDDCKQLITDYGNVGYLTTSNGGEVILKSILFSGDMSEYGNIVMDMFHELNDLALGDGSIVSTIERVIPLMEDTDIHIRLELPLGNPGLDIDTVKSHHRKIVKAFATVNDISYLNTSLVDLSSDVDLVEEDLMGLRMYLSSLNMYENANDLTKNYILWLLASNVHMTPTCEFLDTPIGKYLETGGDGSISLESVLTHYREMNEAKLEKQILEEQELEELLLQADNVLREHNLTESLHRSIVTKKDADKLKSIWVHTPVTGSPLVTDYTSTEIAPMTTKELWNLLPNVAQLQVELTDTWCSLALMSVQDNVEHDSILESGNYYNSFSFAREHNSVAAYTSAKLGQWANVSKITDMSNTRTALLDIDSNLPDSIPTPLFGTDVKKEIRGIRKQLDIWAANTPVEVTSDTAIWLAFYTNLEQVRPMIRYTTNDAPMTWNVTTII